MSWKARLAVSGILFLFFFGLVAPIFAGEVELDKSRMRYDRRTQESYFDVALANLSTTAMSSLIVVIESISDARVTVANGDGVTDKGEPYYDYAELIGDELLDPQEISLPKTWRFSNPSRARFTYTYRIEGEEIVQQVDVEYDALGRVKTLQRLQ